jgi:hypothetical protein
MRALNRLVDEEHRSPAAAARTFLGATSSGSRSSARER